MNSPLVRRTVPVEVMPERIHCQDECLPEAIYKTLNRMIFFNAFLSAFSLSIIVSAACAQGYPSKPLRLIAPTSPGGGSDIFGRQLAQKLTEALGQPVIVENRAGAGGIIGIDYVEIGRAHV